MTNDRRASGGAPALKGSNNFRGAAQWSLASPCTSPSTAQPTAPRPGWLHGTLRIAVIDDDPASYDLFAKSSHLRLGLGRTTFTAEVYTSGRAAMRKITRTPPHIVVVSAGLGGSWGALRCTQNMRVTLSEVPILILGRASQQSAIIPLLAAGASGYLIRPFRARQLGDSIVQVLRRGCALCQEAQTALLNYVQGPGTSHPGSPLTRREREVMSHVAAGRCSKEIAEALHISFNTVDEYVGTVLEKLNCPSRAAASAQLARAGLLTAR